MIKGGEPTHHCSLDKNIRTSKEKERKMNRFLLTALSPIAKLVFVMELYFCVENVVAYAKLTLYLSYVI